MVQPTKKAADILIVDDVIYSINLLQELLTKQGYRTRTAINGEIALLGVSHSAPDLILLDIMMPGMDGFEVCKRLKQDERYSSIPIIFLSALSDISDKVKAFSMGCVDYIAKPFHKEEVLFRVKTHLGLRQINRQLEIEIAERKYSEDALKENEEKFRALTEYSTDVIMRFDRQHRHLYVNPEAERQTGIKPADFIGKTHKELGFPEDLVWLWDEAVEKVFRSGIPSRMEFQLPNKNWVDWLLTPEFSTDRKVVAVIASARDITDRKEFEKAILAINKSFQKDMSAARILQQSFISYTPPQIDWLTIQCRYIPMQEIGGDFISYTILHEGGIGVFIGDVEGHGIPAALFTSMLKVVSDKTCRLFGTRPKDYLRNMNEELIRAKLQTMVTAIYCFVDRNNPDNIKLRFARGGHPAPIFYRSSAKTTLTLNSRGLVLGKISGVMFEEVEMPFAPGDRIFFYTDGIPETRNAKGEMIGFDAMPSLIERCNKGTVAETLDAIISEVQDFRGYIPVDDDVLIVCVECKEIVSKTPKT